MHKACNTALDHTIVTGGVPMWSNTVSYTCSSAGQPATSPSISQNGRHAGAPPPREEGAGERETMSSGDCELCAKSIAPLRNRDRGLSCGDDEPTGECRRSCGDGMVNCGDGELARERSSTSSSSCGEPRRWLSCAVGGECRWSCGNGEPAEDGL